MTTLYKIIPEKLWRDAQALGVFTGSPIDLGDGYIHFSDARTVRETASKHFDGRRDLFLVAVASDLLGESLKWEASRGGRLFPHLYAPLPLTAVLWSRPLPLDAAGFHHFPEDLP